MGDWLLDTAKGIATQVFNDTVRNLDWQAIFSPGYGKLMIDDVIIDLVTDQGIQHVLNTQDHPVAGDHNVVDHAWRAPIEINATGAIVADTQASKDHWIKYKKLVAMMDARKRVRVSINFPPRVFENFRLTNVKFDQTQGRGLPPQGQNWYLINLTLKETQYAVRGAGGGKTQDSGTGNDLEDDTNDMGEKEPQSWGDSDQGATGDQGDIKSGPQDDGMDLWDWAMAGVKWFEDVTGLNAHDLIVDGARALANSIFPGAGLVVDAVDMLITGDVSASRIIEAVGANIPGAGPWVDMMVGGFADAVQGFLENDPTAQKIMDVAKAPREFIKDAIGAFTDPLVKDLPWLQPLNEAAKNWAADIAVDIGGDIVQGAVDTAGKWVSDTAADLGIPPAMLQGAAELGAAAWTYVTSSGSAPDGSAGVDPGVGGPAERPQPVG